MMRSQMRLPASRICLGQSMVCATVELVLNQPSRLSRGCRRPGLAIPSSEYGHAAGVESTPPLAIVKRRG